jgi:hypothetical protein
MVARLHEHVAHSATDHTTNDSADETAQETVASVSDRLIEGGDRDEYGGDRQEFTKCGGTL